jgi:hypothetical protein
MKIEIIGSSCGNCNQMDEVVRKVVAAMKVKAEITRDDTVCGVVKAQGAMTPILKINGKMVSEGRVASPAEVKKWILEAK